MTTFGLKNSENQIIEFDSSLLSAAVYVPVCSEGWIKKPKRGGKRQYFPDLISVSLVKMKYFEDITHSIKGDTIWVPFNIAYIIN